VLERERLARFVLDDLGDANLGFLVDRESALGVLGGELQLLEGERVLADVHTVLRDELVGEQIDHAVVEVVPAQIRIATGREDLEDVLADLEDRDVEGAAAEVVDRDALGQPAAEAIGEGGGGRLVDEAQNLEAGDSARVLGGLALVVIEVGGHGDHGLAHFAAQLSLGHTLHLAEHHGGDLGQRELLLAHLDANTVSGPIGDLVRVDGASLLDLFGEGAPDCPRPPRHRLRSARHWP
jgi:hypothetical protein